MKKLSAYLTAISLVCGVSITALAHEAPVVDAASQQQMDSGVSTQPVAASSGSWQPVASNNGPATTTASAADNAGAATNTTSQWQPVSTTTTSTSTTSGAQTASAAPSPVASSSVVSDTASVPTGSVSKRVARLEQQISNYNQMNLPQQVTDLQQKNAQLQGQLEVAQHNLKALKDNQKLYYQDLEQQIAQLEKEKGVKPTQLASNTNSTASAPTPTTGFVKRSDQDSNADVTSGTASENAADNSNQTQTASKQSAPEINLLKKPKVPSLSDADTYDKAFHALSDKHFDVAEKGFQTYLRDYPKGRFAVNAHFWMGEIALMHEKYDAAKKQFQIVVTQYPSSPKVSDSKLKIAMINAAQGKMELARKQFEEIQKRYPGSTAAQLASIRLQQLANATSVSVQ